MRKLIYSMMVTVDGFIAGPEGNLDWGSVDEELHTFVNEQDRNVGAHLYGRRTYQVMVDFWSSPAAVDPSQPEYIRDYADIWRAVPKFVFSRTLEQVGDNATLVHGDLAGTIRALKQEPGGDLIVGGATFAASVMQHDLIDEYQLYIHPALIGRGVPMFPERDQRRSLRLRDTRTFDSGVVFLRYEVDRTA